MTTWTQFKWYVIIIVLVVLAGILLTVKSQAGNATGWHTQATRIITQSGGGTVIETNVFWPATNAAPSQPFLNIDYGLYCQLTNCTYTNWFRIDTNWFQVVGGVTNSLPAPVRFNTNGFCYAGAAPTNAGAFGVPFTNFLGVSSQIPSNKLSLCVPAQLQPGTCLPCTIADGGVTYSSNTWMRDVLMAEDSDEKYRWLYMLGRDETDVVAGVTNIIYWYQGSIEDWAGTNGPWVGPSSDGSLARSFNTVPGMWYPLYGFVSRVTYLSPGPTNNFLLTNPNLALHPWLYNGTQQWQYAYSPTNLNLGVEDVENLDVYFAFQERFESSLFLFPQNDEDFSILGVGYFQEYSPAIAFRDAGGSSYLLNMQEGTDLGVFNGGWRLGYSTPPAPFTPSQQAGVGTFPVPNIDAKHLQQAKYNILKMVTLSSESAGNVYGNINDPNYPIQRWEFNFVVKELADSNGDFSSYLSSTLVTNTTKVNPDTGGATSVWYNVSHPPIPRWGVAHVTNFSFGALVVGAGSALGIVEGFGNAGWTLNPNFTETGGDFSKWVQVEPTRDAFSPEVWIFGLLDKLPHGYIHSTLRVPYSNAVPGFVAGHPELFTATNVDTDATMIYGSYFNYTPNRRFTKGNPGNGHIVTNTWTFPNVWIDLRSNVTSQLQYFYYGAPSASARVDVFISPPAENAATWKPQVSVPTNPTPHTVTNVNVTITNPLRLDGNTFGVFPTGCRGDINCINPNTIVADVCFTLTKANSFTITTNCDNLAITNGVLCSSTSSNNGLLVTNVTSVLFQVIHEQNYDLTNYLSGGVTPAAAITNRDVLLSVIYSNSVNLTNAVYISTNYDIAEGFHEIDYGWDGVKQILNDWTWEAYPLTAYSTNFSMAGRFTISNLVDATQLGIIGTTNHYNASQNGFWSVNDTAAGDGTLTLFNISPLVWSNGSSHLTITNTFGSWPSAVAWQNKGAAHLQLWREIVSNTGVGACTNVGLPRTNFAYFFAQCPPQNYANSSGPPCSDPCLTTYSFTVINDNITVPNDLVQYAFGCGCTPTNIDQVTGGLKVSSVLAFPEFLTNFAGSADLYIHTARPVNYQLPLVVPAEANVGSYNAGTLFGGYLNGCNLNTNRTIGNIKTNFTQAYPGPAAFSCAQSISNCAYAGDSAFFYPFWTISGGLPVISRAYRHGFAPSSITTNFNVPLYPSEVMWNDFGTGLAFDDHNNSGIWQRYPTNAISSTATFSANIVFDNLVGTGFGTVPTSDFVQGWGIDQAVVLIKWDATNGVNSVTNNGFRFK